MAEQTDSKVAKIVGVLAAAAATWAAGKLIESAWTRATGHTPPKPEDPDGPFGEILAAAVASGALIALVRVVATRGTRRLLG